jgi:thiol-disulfide isomerase/thioredoxin
MLKIVAFLVFLSTVSTAQQFVVVGKIVGLDGTPFPALRIRASSHDLALASTSADGFFKIALPRGEPRHLYVEADKKYGYGCIIPLLTDGDDSVNVTITLDTVMQASFEFADPGQRTAIFAHVHLALSRSYYDFVEGLQKLQRDGRDTKSFISAWMDSAAELKRRAVTEKDPVISGEYLIRYYRLTSIHGMTFDTSFYRRAVTSIPANSPLWLYNNYEAYDQGFLQADGKAYLDSIREYHPSRDLRAFIYFQTAMDAQTAMNYDEVRRNYARLKEDFPDIRWSKIADQWIFVNTTLKRGTEIPDFSLKDIDDSSIVYSKSSLKGSVYLLDFWATWCLPCRGEIPYLQSAFEKYHVKGLHIISVSSDVKKSDVSDFRNQKAGMPWKHVWVSESQRKIIHDLFEVTGIPKPILVGRDGMVIDLGSNLRGEQLDTALEKALGK